MKNVLKDLFKSRVIRFSLLGCILFCLSLHLYTQWDLKRFEASMQKKRPSTLDPAVADAETSEAATSTENAQGGHWHGDVWHPRAHSAEEQHAIAQQETEEDWSDVTPEQRAQIEKLRADQLAAYIAKWGEPPSPDASYKHVRDNHGNVLRHYQGTSVLTDYETRIGFAPNPAQIVEFKRLRNILRKLINADERNGRTAANPSVDVQRYFDEIHALVDSAQAEIPARESFGFLYWGHSNTGFPSAEEDERMDAVAIRDLYRRMGVEHLYEFYEESREWAIPGYSKENDR